MTLKKYNKKGGAELGQGAIGRVLDFEGLWKKDDSPRTLPPPFPNVQISDVQIYDTDLKPVQVPTDDYLLRRYTNTLMNIIVYKVALSNDGVVDSEEEAISRIRSATENIDSGDIPDMIKELAANRIVAKLTSRLNNIPTPFFNPQKSRLRNSLNAYTPDLPNTYLFAIINFQGKKYLSPVYDKYDGDLVAYFKNGEFPKTIDVLEQIATTVLRTNAVLNGNNYFHFDLKPANILFKRDRDRFTFAVADYGFLGTYKATQFPGTPAFQSPLTFNYFAACVADKQNKGDVLLTDEDCQNITNSYENINDLYLEAIIKFSVAGDDCPGDSENLMDVVQNCSTYKEKVEKFTGEVSKRHLSEAYWSTFNDLVKRSLENLCNGTTNSSGKNKCPEVDAITKELMNIVYQKNELYATGITLKECMRKMNVDEQTKRLMKKSVQSGFIKHLTSANVSVDTTGNREDFFFCDEALEYLKKHGILNRQNNIGRND